MFEANHDSGEIWGLVLAAGDGARLRGWTADGEGRHVPKQYCALADERSLLRATLDRASRLIPRRRIVVVVAAAHREQWSRELADWPAENVVVQPANKGTAAGLLLPLLQIAGRDARARVAVFPSDHHVADERLFLGAVSEALAALERPLDRVVLLGMTPESADADLGWIEPFPDAVGSLRPVARFVEKPAPQVATELASRGARWNSFVLAARLDALLALYVRRAPELLDRMTAIVLPRRPLADRATALGDLYASLAPLDFSRDLLTGSESGLLMLDVPACGWTDLGTPERLAACRVAIAAARERTPERRRLATIRAFLQPALVS